MTDLMRAEYEALPEAVRWAISYQEFLWLPESERAALQQTLTEPDVDL